MKIASQANFGSFDQSAEVFDQALQVFAVVVVARVGMGRDYGVLDAVGCRHAAHGLGGLPILGAVVYFGENVTVDIDHSVRGI
jgi:hypothetical protein